MNICTPSPPPTPETFPLSQSSQILTLVLLWHILKVMAYNVEVKAGFMWRLNIYILEWIRHSHPKWGRGLPMSTARSREARRPTSMVEKETAKEGVFPHYPFLLWVRWCSPRWSYNGVESCVCEAFWEYKETPVQLTFHVINHSVLWMKHMHTTGRWAYQSPR